MLVYDVCLLAVIVCLVSVRFGFHLFYNSKIFLLILSMICIFSFNSTRFKNHLFVYISTTKNNESNTKPEEWKKRTVQEEIRKLETILKKKKTKNN